MSTGMAPPPAAITYPDSDGRPMSDNTKQARWIFIFYGNLCALFHGRQDVFVAADLLWYPREGQNQIRIGPDVLVVFGRPRGDRGSYQQWLEGNVPLTVVFEILSPSNTVAEMYAKHAFYEQYGVEEYYVYDPDENILEVYHREGSELRRIRPAQGHISPRLGIRFDLSGEELRVYNPDGSPFLTFEELNAAWKQATQQRDAAEQRADRLATLTRKVLLQQISSEEREELQRLIEPPPA